MQFSMQQVVLGITGGIAAYKAAELTRLLVQAGVQVRVVMTECATKLIAPQTFQALSGHPVLTDLWGEQTADGMAHIHLSRDANAIIVAPATADFIAKLAQGRADNLLSTLCLARTCPLLVAPAMNVHMWENAATQRNLAQIRADGVTVLGPDLGAQACGDTGLGRMLEPNRLFTLLDRHGRPKPLHGKRVMVTAGPTHEPIDAVRCLSNLSSGKMGFAVAHAAADAGAVVTLIAGPVGLPTPVGVQRINVTTATDMLNAVQTTIADQDYFIAVAAVADYQPLHPSTQKRKKTAEHESLVLTPTPDILALVANRPNPPFCVGFAAESENLLEFAEAKRKKKKIPLIAANWIADGFNQENNRLTLLDDTGCYPLPEADKLTLARQLIAHAAQHNLPIRTTPCPPST